MPSYSIMENADVATHTESMALQPLALSTVPMVMVDVVEIM
jgi:hypothetical protein